MQALVIICVGILILTSIWAWIVIKKEKYEETDQAAKRPISEYTFLNMSNNPNFQKYLSDVEVVNDGTRETCGPLPKAKKPAGTTLEPQTYASYYANDILPSVYVNVKWV